jgi:hypothetical protein
MYIGLHAEYRSFLPGVNKTWIYRLISENPLKSDFMNTRPEEAKLFHADGQTDSHEETNSRFSQFCEKSPSNSCMAITN